MCHMYSLTESVGVERQTLELQEVPDGGRKNFDLVPRQIHRPQVAGEPLQLLWKLKQTREEISDRSLLRDDHCRGNPAC